MAVLGVTLAVMSYGFVQIVRGNRKTRLFFIFSSLSLDIRFFDRDLTHLCAQGGEGGNCGCEAEHSSILAIRGRPPVSLVSLFLVFGMSHVLL